MYFTPTRDDAIASFRSERVPVDEIVSFHGF